MISSPPFERGARKPDPAALASASTAAVLICSSDGRRDILERVLPSIRRAWAGAPYPLYVGVNSPLATGPGTVPLVAPVAQWWQECTRGARPVEVQTGIEQVSQGHPFFSSLQVAIWKKQHLLALLDHQTSIWDFERLHIPSVPHYAVCGDAPRHLSPCDRERALAALRPLATGTGRAGGRSGEPQRVVEDPLRPTLAG